jgi:hypothetical protein
MNTLARIVRAREALEDGDIGFAYDLLTDLEHDLAGGSDTHTRPNSFPCPECGLHFTRPGQLADHRDRVHWREAA